MGIQEKFNPPYIQERERKLMEVEKTKKIREEAERKEIELLEGKIEGVLSELVSIASWDLASEKYGEESYKHEIEFQNLRRRIEKKIKDYLSQNPNTRKRLYDKAMKEKYPKQVIPTELINIYKKDIEGGKERIPTNTEKEEIERVIDAVAHEYFKNQGLDQRLPLKKDSSRSELEKDRAKEKRMRNAKNFISSLAIKYFKSNGRVPKEIDLLKLVNESLQN